MAKRTWRAYMCIFFLKMWLLMFLAVSGRRGLGVVCVLLGEFRFSVLGWEVILCKHHRPCVSTSHTVKGNYDKMNCCMLLYCTMECLSNKARGGVVYGQYTTAKCCSYARRNAEFLDTALSPDILAIYHKPPRCLIAIINWLPT